MQLLAQDLLLWPVSVSKKEKSTQITSLQPTCSPQVPNCQSPSRQKISSSWKKNYKYTLKNESISQGKIIFNHTLGENMLVPSKNRPLFSAKPIKNCQPKKKTRKGTEASIIFPTKLAPFHPFPNDSTFNTHWNNPSNWRATARHGPWYPDSRDVCCQSPKRRATAAFLPKWRKSSSHLLFRPGTTFRKPRCGSRKLGVFSPIFGSC